MANKERQKRSVRKARAEERAQREAAQAQATAHMTEKERKAEAKALKKAEAKEARAQKAAERRNSSKLGGYFGGVRSEMHRVVWPTKAELTNYAIAIIVLLIIFGVVLWLVDSGIVAALIGFTGLRG